MFSGETLRNGIAGGNSFFKKVVKFTPVKHATLGVQQFFSSFYFWPEAHQTKIIFLHSLTINLRDYVLPIILYYRSMKVLKEDYLHDYPLTHDYLVPVLDAAITATLLSRLFTRRFIDNTFIALSLSRAVHNDLAEYRPRLLAEKITPLLEELATELTIPLNINITQAYANLFARHFATQAMNGAAFLALKKPLSAVTLHPGIIPNHRNTPLGAKIHKAVEMFLVEFAAAFELKKPNHDKNPPSEPALKKFLVNLKHMRDEVQPFLPIAYHPMCSCYLEKKLHADISSYFYFAGNLLLTYLPAMFHDRQFMGDSLYNMLHVPTLLMRAMIYGQSFNEAKISAEKHCTKHRYREFMRNKMHSIGVGLAYTLASQLCIYTYFYLLDYYKDFKLSALEFFFLNDALANLAVQFASISYLSYNLPLPGRQRNPWDIFLGPRKVTQWATAWLLYLFEENEPDTLNEINDAADENIKPPEEGLIPWLKTGFRSRYFAYVMNYFLTGSDLLPAADLSKDPLAVFLKIPTVAMFLSLYQKDLQATANDFQKWNAATNHWLVDTLVVTPLLFFMPAIKMPLKIIKDKDLELILTKVKQASLVNHPVLLADHSVTNFTGKTPVIADYTPVNNVAAELNDVKAMAAEIAEKEEIDEIAADKRVIQSDDEAEEEFALVYNSTSVSKNSASKMRQYSIWAMQEIAARTKQVAVVTTRKFSQKRMV